MAEFPASHTTGAGGAGQTQPGATGRPYLDINLAKSLPGLLKIAQAGVCFIAFIVCAAVGIGSNSGWSAFVAFVGMVGAIGFWVLVVCHVVELLPRLPWEVVELGFYALWTFFLFVAFCCMCAVASWGWGAAGFAAFLLIVATILFGLDAFLKFRAWRTASTLPPPPVPDPRTPA